MLPLTILVSVVSNSIKRNMQNSEYGLNYPKLRSIMSQLRTMHVCKGGQILAPPGAIFPRKFGPGGQIFGGAKFPVTPAHMNSPLGCKLFMVFVSKY